MQLVEKMDAGPVYLQEEIALAEDETTASLQAKLTPLGARLLLETIRRLKRGDLTERLQNENEVTFAPTIKKEDGLVDWTLPAEAIEQCDARQPGHPHVGDQHVRLAVYDRLEQVLGALEGA